MKRLARLPHDGNTWLGFGHTVAHGEDQGEIRPFAEGTRLCAAVLLPPSTLGEEAFCMRRPNGGDVFFWAAVPLHLAELKFKMQNGIEPLLDLFDQHRVTDRVDPARSSVV